MGKNLGEVRELGEFIPPTSSQQTLLQSSEVLLWETVSQRNLERKTHYHQECSADFHHLGADPQVADCGKSASFPEPSVTHANRDRDGPPPLVGSLDKDKYLLSTIMCLVLIIRVGHMG